MANSLEKGKTIMGKTIKKAFVGRGFKFKAE